MKIAVYSIAKNEEEFANRWSKTAESADLRLVVDTGSTDNTIELLKQNGVTVHSRIIDPWRFDEARNASLNLIPEDVDVCISLDMDEVLCDNWRKFLEEAWTKQTTMLRYPFMCKPRSTYGFKVHSRHIYSWKYAIHEVLVPKIGWNYQTHTESWSEKFTISHLPKNEKSSYLKELLYWHKKEPTETRYIFYLAREYFDTQNYDVSKFYLQSYLASPQIKDQNEECFVHRMISWCLKYTKENHDEMIRHLFIGIGITPNSPQIWGHLAEEMYEIGNYPNAFSAATNALKIKDKSAVYSIEEGWGDKMQKILNISAFSMGVSSDKLKAIIGK